MKFCHNLPILLFVALVACRTETVEVNTPDEIQPGTSSGLVVNRLDSLVIGAYHSLVNCDLDIDGNLTPDFRLTSEVWGSPGMGQHPRASLMSLNDRSLFNGQILNDTTFFSESSNVTSGENETPVIVSHTRSYSCSRINFDDSIVSVRPNLFAVRYFQPGESIRRSDPFQADTLTLTDGYSSQEVGVENRNDTIIHHWDFYHTTCYTMPGDRIWYVGIKLVVGDAEKIGWIKMALMDNYKILVLETAIIDK